jgi:N-sulfoglucosamine sulfohydrolase
MPPVAVPNILLINTHDSGRFFGCYGVETVCSPRVDSMAKEGVLFENMMAASPICSPSRGAMVTGRWPQRNGLLGLTHHGFHLRAGERHLAAFFKEAGYATVLFHFQHVAEKEAWADLGFEEFLARSRDDEEPVYPKMARPAPEVADAFALYLQTRGGEKPFFAQVNFNETHTPFDFGGVQPDRSGGVTIPPWIEADADADAHFAHLQGAVSALDRGVGRLLDALRDNSLEANTVVLFVTDHGLEGARDKWSCYEAGLGIAAIARWPQGGVAGGRRVGAPVSNVDILPTLLDFAGIERPDNLDGHTLAPVLRSEREADPERPVFAIYHNAGIRSVRVGRWKLIRNFSAEPYAEEPPATLRRRKPLHPKPPVELYDLATDPHELTNIATSQAARVRTLDAHLAGWMRAVNDPVYFS